MKLVLKAWSIVYKQIDVLSALEVRHYKKMEDATHAPAALIILTKLSAVWIAGKTLFLIIQLNHVYVFQGLIITQQLRLALPVEISLFITVLLENVKDAQLAKFSIKVIATFVQMVLITMLQIIPVWNVLMTHFITQQLACVKLNAQMDQFLIYFPIHANVHLRNLSPMVLTA